MAKIATEMRVDRVRRDSPDTKTVRLEWPPGYDVEFQTGQFIALFWPDEPHYVRAYSLASCALERGYFDITVKREGRMGTRLADRVQPGDKLMVLPPVGHLQPVLSADHHLFCIAGGIGVIPYRAFAREAMLRQAETRITILCSVRTPANILFAEEWQGLARTNARFQFHVTCTRPVANGSWPWLRGRIDADMVKSLVTDPAKTIFYACGPNTLVEAAAKMVINELHVPRMQFRAEKWGALSE